MTTATASDSWIACRKPNPQARLRLFCFPPEIGPQIPHHDRPSHSLPEGELLVELRRLNGIPGKVLEDVQLMQIMLPVLRADLALFETYVYSTEPPLKCPISAFGGLQDHRVSRSHLEAWRDQTSASFSLRMFPGDHFFWHTTQLLSQDLREDG